MCCRRRCRKWLDSAVGFSQLSSNALFCPEESVFTVFTYDSEPDMVSWLWRVIQRWWGVTGDTRLEGFSRWTTWRGDRSTLFDSAGPRFCRAWNLVLMSIGTKRSLWRPSPPSCCCSSNTSNSTTSTRYPRCCAVVAQPETKRNTVCVLVPIVWVHGSTLGVCKLHPAHFEVLQSEHHVLHYSQKQVRFCTNLRNTNPLNCTWMCVFWSSTASQFSTFLIVSSMSSPS